ncbi:MAG: ABC transporter permease [Cellvibrionales bacterium]|nr:ABC transporter permease [Cellvibrionales bacterium]
MSETLHTQKTTSYPWLAYAIKRLISGVIAIWFIATATFFGMHLIPGDPLSSEKKMSPQIRKNLEARYGLDKPLLTQYGIFLKNIAKGDFGISFTQENRRVNDIIREHFPISALLGVLALIFATLGGIFLGAFAATHKNQLSDHVIMLMVILVVSVPGFVFAALSQLGIMKINDAFNTDFPIAGFSSLSHLVVPSIVLGLGTLAYLTRLMRSSLLDIESADYIRTAKAKGLSNAQIFAKHKLRNALLPVVTVLGPAVAGITTGGFVVEMIFAIPGLGKYFVEAVQQLDYTVIMGTAVFYGGFLVLTVILVDILYGWVDPRIQVVK